MRAPDGSSFKVTKGAAHAVLGLVQVDPEVAAAVVNRKACALPAFYPPHHAQLSLSFQPSRSAAPCDPNSASRFVSRLPFWQGFTGNVRP